MIKQQNQYQSLNVDGQEDINIQNIPKQKLKKKLLIYILGIAFIVQSFTIIAQGISISRYRKDYGKAEQLFFNNSLSFYVVGDWGRQKNANQNSVALAMSQLAKEQVPQFILSTGDNFYQSGLSSFSDVEFNKSFMNAYNQETLQDIPWHAILGNHDYGDGRSKSDNTNCSGVQLSDCKGVCCNSPMWQLGQQLKDRDQRWNCKRQYTMTFGENWIDMFFIDTTPLVQNYQDRIWAYNPGGIKSSNPQALLLELETSLASSKAQWKIVIGHHPVRSNGHHGYTDGLQDVLGPMLAKYKVRVYFNGHDHNLEYIYNESNFTHFVTSGAGSDTRSIDGGEQDSRFSQGEPGFVSVEMQQDKMYLKFMNSKSSKAVFEDTIQAL